jgi:hypothetical protein
LPGKDLYRINNEQGGILSIGFDDGEVVAVNGECEAG